MVQRNFVVAFGNFTVTAEALRKLHGNFAAALGSFTVTAVTLWNLYSNYGMVSH